MEEKKIKFGEEELAFMSRYIILCDFSFFDGINYYFIDTKKEKGCWLPKIIGKFLFAIVPKRGTMIY